MGLFLKRSIVAFVPYEELNPRVLKGSDFVRKTRKSRVVSVRTGAGAGFVGGVPIALLSSGATGRIKMLPLVLGATGGAGAGIGAFAGYKVGSENVRRATEILRKMILRRSGGIVDRAGRVVFNPDKHFGIATSEGGVYLVKKTWFQKTLKLLQKAGISPARYRF